MLQISLLVPFIVISYYKHSFLLSVNISILCGLFLDLLGNGTHLGLNVLSYAIATFMLYPRRQQFIETPLFTIPFLSFLFAIFATIVHWLAFNIFEHSLHWTLEWVVSELIIMPFYDAVYAFICFVIPLQLWKYLRSKTKPNVILNKYKL
jgi:rod shape-determining protein MreD